jgi:tetratricopeptide (TPR) repeat protein/NAD-dependent SIR2 family protein deacetylase
MKIEEIVNKVLEENQEAVLKDLFSENKTYSFLVGAGISMDPPSNLPSARIFVKSLFKYYAPEEEIEKLSSLDSLRYEFLVEKVQNLFDNDIKFLDYLDHVKEPNAIHFFLANMIMKYNYVITTNFDYLLEMAMQKKLSIYPIFNYFHAKFMVIVTKEDYDKDVINQFPIIKIHGSKWDCIKGRSTKDSLITTISTLGKEKEKGQTFAIETYKRKLINTVMQDRNLVIMGYSGSDDFDISPMLKELNNMKRIIWIDHNPDANSEELEIYHYNPVQNVSELNSNYEINKLDKILVEISSLNNGDVYKIETNTISFVKEKLAPIYNESFEFLKISTTNEVLSFDDYMKENHFQASQSSKYRLAHEIYYDLGEIESAERTALRGLNLSKESEEDINQTYFTNALGLIYLSKGEYDKAFINFEHTLELTEKLNQFNEKAGVLLNLGEISRKKGDLKNAFKYISEASKIMTNDTPNVLKFSILNNLGALYRDNGDIDNAIRNIELALEISENTGDLFGKALCYNNLAGIKISQGLLNPALKNSSEALKINEQLGDLNNMCSTLNTIGNIFRIAGQYSQALQYFERAYQTADKIQNQNIKALAANSIGVIHYESGKNDLAMRYYNESLMIRKKIGDLSGQATTLNNIGMVYRTNRDYDRAFELINQSIELTEKIGEKKNLAVRYGNRASIYEIRREFEKALEEYKKALITEQSQNNLAGIANQLTNIGGILGDLGRYEETIKHYTDALNIMENLGIKPEIARSLNNLGMIFYKFKKDYQRSIDYLQKALEIYKELNIPNMIMTTLQNLDFIKREFESL